MNSEQKILLVKVWKPLYAMTGVFELILDEHIIALFCIFHLIFLSTVVSLA